MRKYPLLITMITAVILLSLTGYLGRETVYASYADDMVSTPLAALPFLGFTDGLYPWSEVKEEETFTAELPDGILDKKDEAAEPEEDTEEIIEPETVSGNDKGAPAGESAEGSVSGNDLVQVDALGDTTGEDEITEATSETAYVDVEEKVYEFETVTDEYFADAVFIGDSRTVGLWEYCKELADVSTFYAKTSMTIYDCLTDPFIKEGDRKITIDEALQTRQFKKVYLMLGLNEMGTGNNASFIEYYYSVVARILDLQPDAILYVEGLMHVTGNKSGRDRIFNNANINARNEVLSLLADNERIFYIDMNEATDDENGNLTADLSFDGVHLYARAYERWHQFLLNHAIVR